MYSSREILKLKIMAMLGDLKIYNNLEQVCCDESTQIRNIA